MTSVPLHLEIKDKRHICDNPIIEISFSASTDCYLFVSCKLWERQQAFERIGQVFNKLEDLFKLQPAFNHSKLFHLFFQITVVKILF